MNIYLALLLTATFAGGAVLFAPMSAEAYLGLPSAEVTTNNEKIVDANVNTNGTVPTDGSSGAFGYGIVFVDSAGNLDLSNIIVSTTHKGVQDSEAQVDANDASFHNHYVSLTNNQNDAKCPGLEVVDITFTQPGSTSVSGSTVTLADVPLAFSSTHSLTGAPVQFDATGSHIGKAVSFTINPVDASGATSVTDIQAVCINDVTLQDASDAVKSHLAISPPVVSASSSELKRAAIETADAAPTDGSSGAFGYGIVFVDSAGNLDLSNIIVSTTHKGVQDSEAQVDANDASFHNHYVSLTNNQNDAKCPGLEVVDITFTQPGSTSVSGSTVTLADVPLAFSSTHSLTGAPVQFDATGSHIGKAVSFTINPVDASGATSVTDIQAVCINDVSLVDYASRICR